MPVDQAKLVRLTSRFYKTNPSCFAALDQPPECEDGSSQEDDGLQGVGPNDRFDAT